MPSMSVQPISEPILLTTKANQTIDIESSKVLHNWDDGALEFWLMKDGRLLVRVRKSGNVYQCPWHYEKTTREPWLVARRKSFVSLIKWAVKEGDFNDLK